MGFDDLEIAPSEELQAVQGEMVTLMQSICNMLLLNEHPV